MDEEREKYTVPPYTHVVQYYETDAMGIVHHSNYIRWMEEARLDYLRQTGLAYDRMEKRGIVIPVMGVSCQYKAATRYGETVKIFLEMERFTGAKFSITYRITDPEGKVVHAVARSEHGFLTSDMRPFNIKKAAPDIYEFFEQYKV